NRRALHTLDVHLDAQAHANHVALKVLAGRGGHAAHLAILAVDFGDFASVVDVHAGRAGDVVDQCATVFVQHAPQEARAANEPRHVQAMVAEGFGELVGDVATADDDRVPGGADALANGSRIIPVLEVVDALKVWAGAR